MAIKTFKHKGLRKFFESGSKSGIQTAHARKIGLILDLLNGATHVTDMNFPGSNLHPLKGELQGHHAVSVSGNWRIIFCFEDGDAQDVDLVDYH